MNPARLLVLLVSLPLLLVGCGEKHVAESNEPKTEVVNSNKLVERQGITYLVNSGP